MQRAWIVILLLRWLRQQLITLMLKAKWRWLWRHMCRHLILTNGNNPNIISLAPFVWNKRHDENSVFLRENRRFVYESKMAAKRRIWGANLKFDLQSESCRLAIMQQGLLSCNFVILFSQRLRLCKFCLSPLSEPYDPPSWWANIIKYTKGILLKNVDL